MTEAKVYIVGAGPGDPELITVKGMRLLKTCNRLIYTGSLIPKALLSYANPDTKVYSSASLTLDEIVELMAEGYRQGEITLRLHTGDPSLFGAIKEQIVELNRLKIPWQIIPGVSSFAAGAACLGTELTLPEIAQTVILTRISGRTPVGQKESLRVLSQSRATMVLFLSIGYLKEAVDELLETYGADCPVRIVYKASQPEQVMITGTLSNIEGRFKEYCSRVKAINATALIYVGEVFEPDKKTYSRLYSSDFNHGYRGES